MGLFWSSKPAKPRVLVVEDDAQTLDMLCVTLEVGGFEPLKASQGEQALALARKKPQLVLLDLGLPDMDGREVLRRMKEDPATKDVPVIVVTGQQKGEAVETSFGLGAAGFVVKPFDVTALLKKIREVLGIAA